MFYLMLFAVAIVFVMALSLFLGVPFLPTHRKQSELLMELAGVGPGSMVVDLGSGAGRLMFAAARRGAKSVTGYELNPVLYLWTKLMIVLKGYNGQVHVLCKSLYKADVKNADIVTMFLFPQFMPPLEKKLFAECKPGTQLASYTFAFPNVKPDIKKEAIFLYTVPNKRAS